MAKHPPSLRYGAAGRNNVKERDSDFAAFSVFGGSVGLTALHWRHDRDHIARFEAVIAVDEFHAGADENAFVVSAERGNVSVDFA